MKSIIVAFDKKYGIGADNDLLWQRDLPADLRHFRDTTLNSAIVMGYNTYKSIGRPLPGRRNIVIDWNMVPIPGFEVVDSLESAYHLVGPDEDLFVIGGGSVYAAAIDTVDRLICTEVDACFNNATIFFPTIDKKMWKEVSRIKNVADKENLYDYDFVIYERTKK